MVQRLFKKEPGVIHLGTPLTMKRRQRITIRVPASVIQQVHDRLTAAKQ
jgi:hypothetical protein